MARIAAFTSFSFSYMTRAQILLSSLRAAHPDWDICACIVDVAPADIDAAAALAGFDRVVFADTLPIPRFRAWIFKHDLVEACTAVKAHMLQHLLAAGYAQVFYFDPDIAVFHSLDALVEQLERASILLTPHQVAPSPSYAAFRDNELTSLKYGVFNLGFIGVRNSPVGVAFANWWAALLLEACYDDPDSGIFTDQRYIDLAPALFDEVTVLRDPGCNVASWNLANRVLAINALGGITVNNIPLKFYHFTKINGIGDVMTEKYAGDNAAVWEIWTWYKRALAGGDGLGIPKSYWSYATFSDGAPIGKPARILFRNRNDLIAHFEDPFNARADGFACWLRNQRPELLVTDI